MFLDELLKRNRAFVKRHPAKPLPTAEAVSLAVVGCFDPRLDSMLRPALGLAEDEGFLLRTAGASVSATNGALRSLALAVYLFDVRRVLILGHSSCRMASFPTEEFIDAFRSRGVDREAFDDSDLRTWAGALASPRDGVLASLAAISEAPFLPDDLELAGAVLDDTTGQLEVVAKPGEPLPGHVGPMAAGSAASEPAAAPPTAEAASSPSAGAAEPLESLRSVVGSLAASAGAAGEIRKLQGALAAERNPIRKLALVQHFVKDAAVETHQVREAFTELKRRAAGGGHEAATEILSELLLPLFSGGPR